MAKVIRLLIVLAVVAVGAVGAYAWLSGRGDASGGLKLVEIGTGSITEKAIAVGKIEPRNKFQVKSKISGIVRQAAVEVGDRVREGQVLFEIAPDPTPAELVEAQRHAKLTKAQATKVAQMAQDGLARSIRPAHTMFDGDTIFSLSTGEVEADVSTVGAFAAEVMAQAIVRAVKMAKPAGGLPGLDGT